MLPALPVAAPDGPLGSNVNPAVLAASPRLSLRYIRGVQGSPRGENSFWFAAKGVGMGLEYFSASPPVPTPGLLPETVSLRRWTWSGGSHLGGGLYWGVARISYASQDPQYDRLSLWDVGLLYRRQWVSLGLVVRRLNRPELYGQRLERAFDLGVAWRPRTDRLTFSFDLRRLDSESFRTAWKRQRYRLGLNLEPIEGVEIQANAYGNRQFDLAVTLRWGTVGIGGLHRLEEGQKAGTIGWIELREDQTHPPLRRRRIALDLKLQDWEEIYPRLRDDQTVAGVLLRLDGERMPLAHWEALRKQILDLRHRGVEVLIFIRRTGTGGYWIASAADGILIDPLGELELTGLHSRRLYYGPLLERIGLEPIFVRRGPYKAAPESWTQQGPSPAAEHNREALFAELFLRVSTDLTRSRPQISAPLGVLYRQGYFLGAEAVSAGLADDSVTKQEAATQLRERLKAQLLTAQEYRSERHRSRSWTVPPSRIAVIRIQGTLVEKADWFQVASGEVCSAEEIAQALDRARSDDSVRATVLAIDSGGGLVSAAERIWRSVAQAAEEKPIVAVIEGIGASGAYYVATGAHRILAGATSITGSIGVYSGIIGVGGLLDRLGIAASELDYGYAGSTGLWTTSPTPEDRERLERQVGRLYDHFIRSVAERRLLPLPLTIAAAEGQVWTGRSARARGLIDAIGTLEDGIAEAKRLAGIPAQGAVELLWLPEPSWKRRISQMLAPLSGRVPRPWAAIVGEAGGRRLGEPMAYEPLAQWETP